MPVPLSSLLDEARAQLAWFAKRDFIEPRDFVWWLGTAQITETAIALQHRSAAIRGSGDPVLILARCPRL